MRERRGGALVGEVLPPPPRGIIGGESSVIVNVVKTGGFVGKEKVNRGVFWR